MTPPIAEEVQGKIWSWVISHGPFFFLFLLLAGVMVWEGEQDRMQEALFSLMFASGAASVERVH